MDGSAGGRGKFRRVAGGSPRAGTSGIPVSPRRINPVSALKPPPGLHGVPTPVLFLRPLYYREPFDAPSAAGNRLSAGTNVLPFANLPARHFTRVLVLSRAKRLEWSTPNMGNSRSNKVPVRGNKLLGRRTSLGDSFGCTLGSLDLLQPAARRLFLG